MNGEEINETFHEEFTSQATLIAMGNIIPLASNTRQQPWKCLGVKQYRTKRLGFKERINMFQVGMGYGEFTIYWTLARSFNIKGMFFSNYICLYKYLSDSGSSKLRLFISEHQSAIRRGVMVSELILLDQL